MSDPTIRPMSETDIPAAERLSAQGFHELEIRLSPRSWPDPELRSAERGEAWKIRTRHFLSTDPGGCWVAEDDRGLVGFATSYTRELMWVLATYVVRPDAQGQGIGKVLLAAALHHGQGCLRGMLASSADPKAARRYRQSGFSLHPQLALSGTVDRAAIPVIDKVREGSAADIELMDSIDRRTRGAAHGPDHVVMQQLWRLVVSDTTTGSGYAYVDRDGAVMLLAATNRRTASRLLWEALASTSGDTDVRHVTSANEWAIDVGMTARLDLRQDGYLALRAMRPPAPYLHHGTFL